MNIVAFPNSSGAAYWRLIDPLSRLGKAFKCEISTEGITDRLAQWGDVFILQGCVDVEGIALLADYQNRGKKIVVDSDDMLQVEDDNPYKMVHDTYNAVEVIKATMEIANCVTTTTEYLKSKLDEYNENVVVLPNSIDVKRWDLPKQKNDSKVLRIGWCGSVTHYEDLRMIQEPMKRVLKDHPNTQLVLVGDPRLGELFEGYNVECVMGVPFESWPARLHGLRLDIGIAPLVHNEFNKCKSNIKFQEYAIAKIPGVYSPTVYDEQAFDGRSGLIAFDKDHWYRALHNMIVSDVLREDIREHAYEFVIRKYSLKNNISKWERAYLNLFN